MKCRYKVIMSILTLLIFSSYSNKAMEEEIVIQTGVVNKRLHNTSTLKANKVRKMSQEVLTQPTPPESVSAASLGTSREASIYVNDSATDEEENIEASQSTLDKGKQKEVITPSNSEQTSNLVQDQQPESIYINDSVTDEEENTETSRSTLDKGKQKEVITPSNSEQASNLVQDQQPESNSAADKEKNTETSRSTLDKGGQKEVITPPDSEQALNLVQDQQPEFQADLSIGTEVRSLYKVIITNLGNTPLAQCIVESGYSISDIKVYRVAPENKEERKEYPHGIFEDQIFTRKQEVFTVKPSRIVPHLFSIQQFENSFKGRKARVDTVPIFNSPFNDPIFLHKFIQTVIRPYNIVQEFGTVATCAAASIVRMVNSKGIYIGSLTLPPNSIVKHIQVFYTECRTDEEQKNHPQGIFEDQITTTVDHKIRIIRPSRIVPYHVPIKDYMDSLFVVVETIKEDL